MQEMQVQSLGWEDPLEKGIATHSSILTWKIPWTEGPGRLQRVARARKGSSRTELLALSLSHFCPGSPTLLISLGLFSIFHQPVKL